MAHAYVHLAAGMSAGLLISLAYVLLKKRNLYSAHTLRLIALWAYGLGTLAVVPHLAMELKIIDTAPAGLFAYLFVGYPLISESVAGGMLKGQFLIGFIVALLYLVALRTTYKSIGR